MVELLVLSLLIWLPVLFYEMSRRGFLLILGWLLIAPIALNLLGQFGKAPLVEMGAGEGSRSTGGGYLTDDADIAASQLLDPTRILFVGLLAVFLFRSVLKKQVLGRLDATEKFGLLFALILIGSAVSKSNRTGFALRIACDAFIVPFIAYYCARRFIISEERLNKLLTVIAYTGMSVLVICIFERIVNSGLYYRMAGPFKQPTPLHVLMSIIFFISLFDLLRGWRSPLKSRLISKYVRTTILFTAPLVVAHTWARATWLAFLCGLIVFLVLNWRLLPRAVAVLAIGVALTLVPFIILSFTTTWLEQVMQERVTGRTSTIYSRLGAWTIILQEYSKAPILGIGLNNLRDSLVETQTQVEGVRSETHAHNSFLSVLAEQGTVGFLVYLGVLMSIIHMGWRLFKGRHGDDDRLIGSLVIAVMFAYLVPALFTNSLHIPLVHHVYVYTIMGAIARVYGSRASSHDIVNNTAEYPGRVAVHCTVMPRGSA